MTSQTQEIVLKTPFATKLKTPPGLPERYHIYVPVEDLPNIVLGRNPRDQSVWQTKMKFWQVVKNGLLNEYEGPSNIFALVNKGLDISAKSCTIGKGRVVLRLDHGLKHGVDNGGGTLATILNSQAEIAKHNATATGAARITQYVQMFVDVNIPDAAVRYRAAGLNAGVAVRVCSLENLMGDYEEIKDALNNQPYTELLFFSETDRFKDANRPGSPLECGINHLQKVLFCCNVITFPSELPTDLVRGMRGKKLVSDHYKNAKAEYRALLPILPELLILHDLIRRDGVALYNKMPGKSEGGKLRFVKTNANISLPFLNGQRVLHDIDKEMVFPMLSAFRAAMTQTDGGEVRWAVPDFKAVVQIWSRVGGRMMAECKQRCQDLQYNVKLAGKDAALWERQFRFVKEALTSGEKPRR